MPGRLDGKRAVLVGAGQTRGATVGFGRATALLFAREGAQVMVVDVDRDRADETASIVREAGGAAAVHVADHTSDEECAGMAAAAQRELGGVDVLYDGVGIAARMSTLAETSEDTWDRLMSVNLKGMFLATRHILPLMVRQGSGGSIVLISSTGATNAGLRGVQTAYGVAKAGLNRLVLGIAAAHAEHDIRCNAIMPGMIETPMAIEGALSSDGLTVSGLTRDEYVAQRAAAIPMRYKGSAEDVAFAALYFASDESRYVSGACLPVDGALSAA
jgi:NAD(P)-dependent dehydrogenase (short-subunit alcohol dehydrogenase family)